MSYKAPLATTTEFGIVKVGSNLAITDGVISATGIVADSYYGKFFSSTTQTNPVVSTANLISFPNTVLNNEITTSGTAITFNKAGVYTITYEVQAEITTGGGGDIDIWVRLNGVDLPNSNSITTIPGGGNRTIINRSFLVNIVATEVATILWSSTIANMQLTALGTQVGPTRPATNSANFLATLVKAL
jgi:hypothetical protein